MAQFAVQVDPAPDEAVYFLARKHPILLWKALVLPILSFAVPVVTNLWGLLIGVGLFLRFGGGDDLAILGWMVWGGGGLE